MRISDWSSDVCSSDLDGRPSREDYTRVRVQARQVFVFAHASRVGLSDDGLQLAQSAFAFLEEHAWDRAHGGWFHRLRLDGLPLDRTKDCYDHAFVLLALAALSSEERRVGKECVSTCRSRG